MIAGDTGIRLGWTSLAIMAAVSRLAAGATVQAIVDDVERSSGRTVAMPQMYATLPRLERAGLIRRVAIASRAVQGGRRSSRFELTPSGEAAIATVTV